MLLARYAAALTMIAATGFEPTLAQDSAEVEAVPRYRASTCLDLDSVGKDAIALPDEPIVLPQLDSREIVPPKTDTTDPCRHLDEKQRENLTTLCGPNS